MCVQCVCVYECVCVCECVCVTAADMATVWTCPHLELLVGESGTISREDR